METPAIQMAHLQDPRTGRHDHAVCENTYNTNSTQRRPENRSPVCGRVNNTSDTHIRLWLV